MKKLIAEQNLRKDQLSNFFVVVLTVAVVGLCVARIIIANRLVEASEQMREMDRQIELVKEVNQNIAEQLRQPQSVTLIEKKAKALGFIKTSHLVFLGPREQFAMR